MSPYVPLDVPLDVSSQTKCRDASAVFCACAVDMFLIKLSLSLSLSLMRQVLNPIPKPYLNYTLN